MGWQKATHQGRSWGPSRSRVMLREIATSQVENKTCPHLGTAWGDPGPRIIFQSRRCSAICFLKAAKNTSNCSNVFFTPPEDARSASQSKVYTWHICKWCVQPGTTGDVDRHQWGCFHSHMVAALVRAPWMQTRLPTECEVFLSLLMLPLLCHVSFTLTPRAATLQCGCSWRKFEVPPLWIILGSHPWMILGGNNCLRWVTIVRHALDSAKLEKPWMSIYQCNVLAASCVHIAGGRPQ